MIYIYIYIYIVFFFLLLCIFFLTRNILSTKPDTGASAHAIASACERVQVDKSEGGRCMEGGREKKEVGGRELVKVKTKSKNKK